MANEDMGEGNVIDFFLFSIFFFSSRSVRPVLYFGYFVGHMDTTIKQYLTTDDPNTTFTKTNYL
jgi:hypothetical protein